MKIYDYNQFNENILNKAKELLNFSTIRKNDEAAKKYIDLIYNDYKSHNRIWKSKIAINDGYTNFWYKIDNDEFSAAGESSGSEVIEFKLMWINEMGWSDKSGGRIEITQQFPYMGRLPILGRGDNNEIVSNEIDSKKGTSDSITYLNISGSIVKKLIDFFISEWEKQYPTMKGGRDGKYYNSMNIPQDSKYRTDQKANYDKERSDNELKYKRQKDFVNKLFSEIEDKDEIIDDSYLSFLDDYRSEYEIYCNHEIYLYHKYNGDACLSHKLSRAIEGENHNLSRMVMTQKLNYEYPANSKKIDVTGRPILLATDVPFIMNVGYDVITITMKKEIINEFDNSDDLISYLDKRSKRLGKLLSFNSLTNTNKFGEYMLYNPYVDEGSIIYVAIIESNKVI